MIDWTNFDVTSASAWGKLAEQIIANAQVATQSADDASMKGVMDDILAYVAKPATAKPAGCVDAVRRTQTQLAQARQALAIGKLKAGSPELDAIMARMSSAANELKAARATLQLKPVHDALVAAGDVVGQIKGVQAQLKSLPKDALGDRLVAILAGAESVLERLRAVEV